MNKRKLLARQALQTFIHRFFQARDSISVDCPIAVTAPGTEIHLNYFPTAWTDYRGSDHPLFLRSSPELHLKQALSWGLDRVYHLGKCFRNHGELSRWHHPEFTMLEYYESGIGLDDFMQLTDDFVRQAFEVLVPFRDQQVPSLPKTIQRLSMFEAFERWAGIPLLDRDPDLARKGLNKGYHSIRPDDDFETAYFKILLDVIEPEFCKLDAVFIYDYPASQCALAKVKDGRAQRFELYVQGVELCNAFDELLGADANRERIAQSNTERLALGKDPIPEDADFLSALQLGLKACCGNAMGFDRLLALGLGESGIENLIPFRLNRPYGSFLRDSEGHPPA